MSKKIELTSPPSPLKRFKGGLYFDPNYFLVAEIGLNKKITSSIKFSRKSLQQIQVKLCRLFDF